ncbi:MAG: hypothetical protein KBB88_01110 [Candidatus Pacebacteria bacterium]|nr:hypothetical protein [Candidatus Paceibacterota bacterium]
MKMHTPLFRATSRTDWNTIFLSFTKKEWYLFLFLCGLFICSTLFVLFTLSNKFEVIAPAHGGTLVEGILGTPRYINPVIALTDADRDITSLVYSGLTKENKDGDIIPDLAESWTIDESGLVYTFTLKDNVVFQDGEPVTAEDIVYTIETIQNSILKSPLRIKWEGVVVEATDSRTIVFTLKQPFIGFLDNTSVGILPKHKWENVPINEFAFSDFNMYPVGSGPFQVASVSKKATGVPNSITLRSFDQSSTGEPFIDKFVLRFYPNEDARLAALKSGVIDQAGGVAPEDVEQFVLRDMEITTSVLPRVFGIYFNQNKSTVLAQTGIKTAVEKSINRETIVQEALLGYGIAITSPIPPNLVAGLELPAVEAQDFDGAIATLEKNGWKLGDDGFRSKVIDKKDTPLRFSISTSDTPELKKTAELIRDDLSHVGILVDIKVYDSGTLNQQIIRSRDYDALLFGKVVGKENDLFAFWHSSQRNDPGLNISNYVNKTVDSILEKNAREKDPDIRKTNYASFIKEINNDKPAIFLYSPDYIYISNKTVKGLEPSAISSASKRFNTVTSWYIDKQSLWPIFTHNQ